MRAYLREVFDATTSTSALMHLVSLSAFAVAATVATTGVPSHGADPDADAVAPVVRVTLFGNVVGEIDLPQAE